MMRGGCQGFGRIWAGYGRIWAEIGSYVGGGRRYAVGGGKQWEEVSD
jgi:hypothetical protein